VSRRRRLPSPGRGSGRATRRASWALLGRSTCAAGSSPAIAHRWGPRGSRLRGGCGSPDLGGTAASGAGRAAPCAQRTRATRGRATPNGGRYPGTGASRCSTPGLSAHRWGRDGGHGRSLTGPHPQRDTGRCCRSAGWRSRASPPGTPAFRPRSGMPRALGRTALASTRPGRARAAPARPARRTRRHRRRPASPRCSRPQVSSGTAPRSRPARPRHTARTQLPRVRPRQPPPPTRGPPQLLRRPPRGRHCGRPPAPPPARRAQACTARREARRRCGSP